MSDVYAVFGTLLALGIAFPGMLTAWWLIFPGVVGRAQQRLEATPWRCLGLGVLVCVPWLGVILILGALPIGIAKFNAFLLTFLGLSMASLGASGVAALMGGRLTKLTPSGISPLGGFVRGAVALELGAVFPVIGWFVTIPATIFISLGAALFAVLNWMPKEKTQAVAEVALSQA